MSQKRSRWPLWVGLGLIALLAVLVFLRAKAPPEAARLLPESDAIVYINLRPLRTITHWDEPGNLVAPHRSRDLQQFINATGIDPERDLESAAFALHRTGDPHGPNGPVAYSEVFVGHFDSGRLRSYLARLSHGTETYAGHEIFLIPVDGRTLRVTQLGYDTVAASNTPASEQIHSMVDRGNAAALWQPGSSLLATRFHEVPLLALAWGIGRIGLPFGQDGNLSVLGFQLPVPVDTELVASVRYSGALHLRVEEIAPDTLAAQHTTDAVNGILGIVRGVASEVHPGTPREAAMRDLLSSMKTAQHSDRAILTAAVNLPDAHALAAGDNLPMAHETESSPDILDALPKTDPPGATALPTHPGSQLGSQLGSRPGSQPGPKSGVIPH